MMNLILHIIYIAVIVAALIYFNNKIDKAFEELEHAKKYIEREEQKDAKRKRNKGK